MVNRVMGEAQQLVGIDLNLVLPLWALLEEESVTRAARRVGLSTPAMSHALRRVRVQLEDPILVRAGRKMVLTERGRSLVPRVRALARELGAVLSPARPFDPLTLSRALTISATDYVLMVLGSGIDDELIRAAPNVVLRYRPNVVDDAALLRAGTLDFAIGVYGASLPPEVRTTKLFEERLVCVARKGRRDLRKQLSLEQFAAARHIQVAPRLEPGGLIDDRLAAVGLKRRVMRAVPYFWAAVVMVAESDYLLTLPERIARDMAPRHGLRVMETPLDLAPYALRLLWHPRSDGDAGHRFVREAIVRAGRRLE